MNIINDLKISSSNISKGKKKLIINIILGKLNIRRRATRRHYIYNLSLIGVFLN
jgi:hypothetical protein